MQSMFQKPRSVRREVRSPSGHMLAGKLHPAMATQFGQSEGGYVEQSVDMFLEPIAGRMLSAITGQVTSVFVPMPAIDALKNPDDDYPLNSEVYRDKLMTAETVFDVEAEGDISKSLGINPRSVSGTKFVGEQARLAYLVAVNHLRQLAYYKATLVDSAETAILPALFSQSVLKRYAGVLNPEDNINGAVPLQGPDAKVFLKGFGRGDTDYWTYPNDGELVREGGEDSRIAYANSSMVHNHAQGAFYVEENPDKAGYPNLHINLSDQDLGNLKLSDFYRAETMDSLTRAMDQMIKENSVHGQAQALRMAYGLNVNTDNQPMVVYNKEQVFGAAIKSAMDGDNLDKEYTNHMSRFRFTVPIPRTEFGGVLITMISVKPDEALESMPHPFLSKEVSKKNYISDEAVIDPVPVTVRDLDSDAATGDEETVAMFVGNNHLDMLHLDYGFNRLTDMTEVANKSAIWQVNLPTSVTPESISYPSPVDIYPFVLNDDDDPVCHYRLSSTALIQTPLLRGPTPVEEMEVIEDEAIFAAFGVLDDE